MRRSIPLLLTAPLLLAGCDGASGLWSAVEDAVARIAAERPEGWESLDDEGSATRLYYQFVDERRQVRFVERLDEVPEALRGSVGFVKLDVPPPLSPGEAARARGAPLQRSGTARVPSAGPGVILYSADWCPACRKAKRYLSRKGVDYEERNIDEPRHADDLVRKTGRRGIPAIDIGGRILTGFSEQSYDALLDRA